MEFTKYIDGAICTESRDFDMIGRRCGNLPALRLLHSALGFATEIEELENAFNNADHKNIKEEIGDLAWYLAIGYSAATAAFGPLIIMPVQPNRPAALEGCLGMEIGNYIDIVKKHVFYGTPLEADAINLALANVYMALFALTFNSGLAFDHLLEDNLTKLKKRYPEKFTEEAATNRDVNNELSHIEE